MVRIRSKKIVAAFLALALFSGGPAIDAAFASADKPVKASQKEQNVLKGKLTGVSKKAKSISISVGKGEKAKVVMVKYTDTTTGLEFAKKGEAAIITYEVQGKDKIATVIKPKLAKLPEGVAEMQPQELMKLVAIGPEQGKFMLIDARPAPRYAAGHVPYAVSIPVETLKKKGASLLPEDKDFLLIFHCGGPTCGLSTTSAGLAKKLGYTNIKVMLKGVPGWKKAKNTVVASDSQVEKGNIILVDVRPADVAAKGFIDRAVNIPFDELADAKDDFPLKAPVVVYGDEADKAYAMISKWGLKTVALIDGGLEGYVRRGHVLATGEPAIDIDWQRKLGKGEVAMEEFMAVVEGKVAGKKILDVRTTDETAKGKFSNSVAIPLDDLEGRTAELSMDTEYLVHCSTGARAEMAHAVLKKAGMKSRFLVADVECSNAGECSAN